MNPNIFYPIRPNDLRLPKGGRYYFDCNSSEAEEIEEEEKLLHLGYVLSKGFYL